MDPIKYAIHGVPAAVDAALRRRARERGASLNQTVIDALAAALEVAESAGEQSPGAPPPADADLPPALERDALDEGVWL
ncbi:MAG: hypothetical protein OXC12_05270 [Spirochaetaceae bacterium]|nr:hypothetical protein [Spirochaetaceae bacterium]